MGDSYAYAHFGCRIALCQAELAGARRNHCPSLSKQRLSFHVNEILIAVITVFVFGVGYVSACIVGQLQFDFLYPNPKAEA